MFKKTVLSLFALIFGLLITNSANAQGHKKVMTFEGESGKITIIQGIGAVLKEADGELIVEMTMPKENLPKELRHVDLKKDDVVFMCNGKRVATIDEFNEVVDALENGEEIKLGVRRGKERLITSLPKSEGGGNMMMMTTTIDDGGGEETAVNMNGKMMTDVEFMSCGLVINDDNGKPTVVALTPEFKVAGDGPKPEAGDILVSLNGNATENARGVISIYQKVKENETFTLIFSRNGKELKTEIIKPKADGEVIIKNN